MISRVLGGITFYYQEGVFKMDWLENKYSIQYMVSIDKDIWKRRVFDVVAHQTADVSDKQLYDMTNAWFLEVVDELRKLGEFSKQLDKKKESI